MIIKRFPRILIHCKDFYGILRIFKYCRRIFRNFKRFLKDILKFIVEFSGISKDF